ncbi:MAG: hypothetical protein E4G98_04085 [Promethearchaeota archaeon]|nr:MAG: hypothetical protein E4G98_04085 [Candidatus Lokiarchaeota archaeon]
MPLPPTPPHKRDRKKSHFQQQGRGQEIEAKKLLLQFVKTEYAQKKPLEIRLLKMKPSIVFKRGTMLPHLLIKSLQQTAYVVYLDYGQELRYYFFSIAGISMGASTFEKTPDMLTELYGKAITLYKLHKHSALEAFDERSIKLNEEFQKELQQYEKTWGLKIKNPPTLSIITNSLKYHSFRYGIHQEGKIYHVYQAVITPEGNYLNLILSREIFCLAWRLDPTKEVHQALATFWVLSHCDETSGARFQPILQKISPPGKLFPKFKEWIMKVWWPYSTSTANNSKLSKISNITNHRNALVDVMLFFLQAIQRIGLLPWYAWGDLILLYLMTHSWENLHILAEFGIQPSPEHKIHRSYQPEQLLLEIFQFLFTHGQLLQQFQIDFLIGTDVSLKSDEFFLWLAYFCAHSSAYTIANEPTTFPPLITYDHPERFPELTSTLEGWHQKQYSASYEIINRLKGTISDQETKFLSVMDNFLQETIIFHLSHGGIKISEGESEVIFVKRYQPVHQRLQIENLTDVILKEAEYTLECKPTKNLTARFVSRPRSVLFDTKIKFELKISLNKPVTQGKIMLKGNFQHPIDNSKKLQLVLWDSDVAEES